MVANAAAALNDPLEEDEDDETKAQLPCLNCRLIQMGSAISYGDNRCPQCGSEPDG